MRNVLEVILVLMIVSLMPFSGSKDKELQAAQKEDRHLSGSRAIGPYSAYEYCKWIASAEFAGRLTGHSGYTAAARWAAERFRHWMLKPGDRGNGYLQSFPAPYTLVDQAAMTVILPGEIRPTAGNLRSRDGSPANPEPPDRRETRLPLVFGKDFLPLLFTDSGGGTGPLVFVGWGIRAPELGYDDYAGVEVKDRYVLCFRGTPDPSDSRFQIHDEHRTRMRVARDRGALGLIYIRPEMEANPNGDWLPRFLPAMISEQIADQLFREKGVAASELRKDLLLYKRPLSFPLNSRIEYRAQARHFSDAVGYNIAGYIEGNDPKLKKECLVIGAHFDGCGTHGGLTFAGADDNASGSAVVMAVAEAIAGSARRPKRSILFALFGGEEMGLLGSSYFVDHPPGNFGKIDAMFNFDMEGEGDRAYVSVTAEPPQLKTVLEKADAPVLIISGFGVIREVGVRSSDFAPFFRKEIPCAAFYSSGPHIEYHKAGDTIYRINPDILADIARLAYRSAYEWADR